ncbi:transcription antitermination factor NusB [Komagataeibacter rhaeticus]|uniref:Transcription antitermination protein NusB n=1 Tax=Komagataeibacter rhaeticus TaxID=215221 RepID=A0A181C8N5_9PROT|nr:transcription antitermination factor NusB [Komagataeibacter rhaeticus]ATU73357.1 transcription antitermination factor NusB [Komagataeibacter xylinus]EGG76099.1 N utilization substance protein B-like protein [Gluconacetobacter sp. SXCC-1]KDU94455.1 nitrogen utilization protein B [Komagataeibacter rhaeticus AF1]MBL7240462.1 transcription antitermination factor NusB [Komagataeibacter rhaeticus]PYD53419.1 transcription antitermination factor NusB [Komagataeibacter rhaeticus]
MTQTDGDRQPKVRSRTASRVAAVQALFQIEQAGESPEHVINQFNRHRLGTSVVQDGSYAEGQVPDADARLFGIVVRGAVARQERIDGLLHEILPASWPLARLDPVLRAIMHAAGGEMTGADPVPARVIINEYMDIAHGFLAGDEPRMLNGVLDALSRRLQEPAAQPAMDVTPDTPES